MKLLVNLFIKYMSADNDANNLFDLKLLNKKRGKTKSKIRKSMSRYISKKEEEDFLQKNINEEKNINIAQQNIRHFFHFNWDDDLYEKESVKIGKYITSPIYWFLIDSSYFSEDNLENNLKKITDEYLEISSIINGTKEELNKEKNSINKNNNIINNFDKTKLSDNIISKMFFNRSYSVINYLNYDKKGKYFPSVLGYDAAKENINYIKEEIKYYINFINQRNKDKIKKLQLKAKEILSQYNSKNNYKKNSIILNDDNKLDESYLYSKNQESYNIRNKFWNYLYQKEKDYMIKRDERNEQEKDSKDNKNEEKEDNFYINCCNICNVEDLGQYNYLYECVQCGIKVHQLCYRIKTNPDPRRWKCSKCKILSCTEANNLQCILCPCRGGAMQRAKISKESPFYKKIISIRSKEENKLSNPLTHSDHHKKSESNQEYPWIHLSCALWNNDVKIDIYDKKKNIKFDEENILKNYNNLCHICKLRNVGPTIKCIYPNCKIYCHPECARSNDYYLEMESTFKIWKFSLYCQYHRPNRFIKYINKMIKASYDEIFYFKDALDYVYNLYKEFKSKEFYPSLSGPKSENDIGLMDDEDESNNILLKKNLSKRHSKFKRNFSKKRKLHSSSRHSIYISINNKENNYDIKFDKIINNPIEENNLLKNCVSHIKINNEENDKIFPSSVDNSRLIINNSQLNMNLTNETNSIKSNISHNYSNSSDNNKLSTKNESFIPAILDPKDDFAFCLVKYLRNFIIKNRIICKKNNGKYDLPEKEDLDDGILDIIREFTYEDLKNKEYNLKNMEFKGYDKSNKNYEDIYKDEDEFNSYFEKQIDYFSNKENLKDTEIKAEEIDNKMEHKNKMRSGKSRKYN